MSTDQNENKEQTFHLTSGQKGLWLLHNIDPSSDRYHLPVTFKISKNITIKTLNKVFTQLLCRHSLLASTFHEQHGTVFRKVVH